MCVKNCRRAVIYLAERVESLSLSNLADPHKPQSSPYASTMEENRPSYRPLEERGLVCEKTSQEAHTEEAFYDASESHPDEDYSEIDTGAHRELEMQDLKSSRSPLSVGASETKPIRTSRRQRMSMKANSNIKKTTLGGLAFRKSGTKESIGSTCSTVVGSTFGDGSYHRRMRQGSDLSALSHCTEVSERSPHTVTSVHDNSSSDESEEEESLRDMHQISPRIRKISIQENAESPVSFQASDLTSKSRTSDLTGDNSEREEHQTDQPDTEGKVGEDDDNPTPHPSLCVPGRQSSSSLSKVEDVQNDANDDSSSSDDEIAYDFDSSSESGSIEISGSSAALDADSTGRDAGNKSSKDGQFFSPAFRTTFNKQVNTIRLICGKIVNHPYVQNCIVFLIIMNALQMGLATFDFVDEDPHRQALFEKVDLAFLVVFTVESAFQLTFHGTKLFKDGWLTFDFLIVLFSWCFASSSLQVFRTIRTLRLVARVKLLRKLLEALMEVMPRLTGILFLFILIMYIYAVMITVLFGDMWKRGLTSDDYFSRLDTTLFTLFQMITLDWANIVREVMEVYPLSWAIFSTYLSFTSFILFSLVIGVVCDAVSCIEHDANLAERLEKKKDSQVRILRLQHQVDYLKKQQTSVLASVQTVVDRIVEQERFSLQNSGGARVVWSKKTQERMTEDSEIRSKGEYGETTDAVINQHLSAFG